MGELIVFIIFAAVALVGAIVMVTSSNTVYAAIGLLSAMFAIAVLYIALDAHFIAAVQVIVYAGAVMTLFLFAIMLIGVDRPETYGPVSAGQKAMFSHQSGHPMAANALIQFLRHSTRAVHAAGPRMDGPDLGGDAHVGALPLREAA